MKNIYFEGVYIKHNQNETILGYSTKAQENRARFLLEHELKKGKTEFEISQKPVFELCGPMLDVSRGAIMTPEAVCAFLDKCAILGINMAMLYTEDVYKMPEYPKFGYMRGGYTKEQLQMIDDHAHSLGIELIPCIQTLGHLRNYLQWKEVPSDVSGVLLVGNDEVYKFIECEIKTMRSALRSNKIHIGMDEAAGLGTGRYLSENGYENCHDILNKHLARVLEIAHKYDYSPIMWSDMFFSALDLQAYYNADSVIPQDTIDNAPSGVELMFWDYYHKDYDYYHKKFVQQERFPNNPSSFAGGIWTWDGFLCNFKYTLETMLPALEAAVNHNIKSVLATIWSGTGIETDVVSGLGAMAIFSEYCYRGKECTEDDIYEIAEAISGENKELTLALSDFWADYDGSIRIGTAILYCDPLIDTLCYDVDFDDIISRYKNSLTIIEKYKNNPRYSYYKSLFQSALGKAEILKNLRPAYLGGDTDYLAHVAYEAIPRLDSCINELYNEFKKVWRDSYMPFGYEKVSVRFGGISYRLRETASILDAYINKKSSTIEELDCERVSGINVSWMTAPFYTKG